MEKIDVRHEVYFNIDIFILLNLTVVFVIYIVLMNLFLIIAILTDVDMRGRLFFKLILLIAVAHFLQGLLVMPLRIDYTFLGGKLTRDPDICTFWHLTDLTLIVVLAMLLLMLMFERFFSLTYPQIVANRCLGLLMLASPWILSTAYVVFLYFALPIDFYQTMINIIDGTVETCNLGYYVQGIYSFFGFLCPVVFVFGFCWANVVILCLLRKRCAEASTEDNPASHTSTASLVALMFIAMWFPANSRMILPAKFTFISEPGAVYFGFANAALTPTLWLILPKIKRGFNRLCCCCCIACCGSCGQSERHPGAVVSSAVDESQIRMLGHERVQPSATTKL